MTRPPRTAQHTMSRYSTRRPLGPELLRNTRAAAALRPDRGGAARRSSAATSRGAVERRAATATDRASFGSFLFVAPVARSRTRATQLGLHIKYPLARRPQLLGEQGAEPGGALDRPGRLRPCPEPLCRPRPARSAPPRPRAARQASSPRRIRCPARA